MAKDKTVKTNAMRILDREKVEYEFQSYECDEFIDGQATADKLGLKHEQVFKTLVTIAHSKKYYVFVIPIDAELDMKKAARTVSEKSVEMIPVKEITSVTGYVRGGCTAIGMKKQYTTVIDSSATQYDKIHVSAGKIGAQLTLSPVDLQKVARAEFGEITVTQI